MKSGQHKIFLLLQLAAITVFAGRAWQHLFWDAPYREVFWDPDFTKSIIEGLTSLSWEEYVTHPKGDILFQRFVLLQGAFYALCAVLTIFIKKIPAWARGILWLAAANLFFLALIYLKDKFYHLGQFFEYSLQFSSPLFLYYFLKKEKLSKRLVIWMKVAIALTFTCHGLYAVGYYPMPVTFLQMLKAILNMEGAPALAFLKVAGLLDFVVAIGIFLKKRWAVPVLVYAVVWGFLTSMARIIGNFYWDFPLESLDQWVFEAVYRFPHFLVPMALLFWMKVGEKRL
ncbi:MAG TPA: hypothetical protein ENJ95_11545 [Bacteroidetes bacterium]|nr:hypothetical protein [Bacteroidota bacterium]